MVYFALISLPPFWGNQPVVIMSFSQVLLLYPVSFAKPSYAGRPAFAGDVQPKQLQPLRLIEL